MLTLIQIIQPDAATYDDRIDRSGLPPVSGSKLLARKRSYNDNPAHMMILLEAIFAWFNAGSGEECQEFLAAGMRSLSVGDYVIVRELDDSSLLLESSRVCINRCDKDRWTEVSWTQMERDIEEGRNMPDWMIESRRKQGKETA